MATGPPVARSPLEVLENDGTRELSLASQYMIPCIFGAMGFLGPILHNMSQRRPGLSGIQKHFFFAAVTGVAAKYIDNYREGYLAERDAMFRHYIQLHPEEFPDYPRRKYSEFLEDWIPIR